MHLPAVEFRSSGAVPCSRVLELYTFPFGPRDATTYPCVNLVLLDPFMERERCTANLRDDRFNRRLQ